MERIPRCRNRSSSRVTAPPFGKSGILLPGLAAGQSRLTGRSESFTRMMSSMQCLVPESFHCNRFGNRHLRPACVAADSAPSDSSNWQYDHRLWLCGLPACLPSVNRPAGSETGTGVPCLRQPPPTTRMPGAHTSMHTGALLHSPVSLWHPNGRRDHGAVADCLPGRAATSSSPNRLVMTYRMPASPCNCPKRGEPESPCSRSPAIIGASTN